MNATTSPLGPDFIKQVVDLLTIGIAQATAHAYRMMWDILLSFLAQHWLGTLITLICILLLAILEYIITHRWAALGSVLYNYFYFGLMFIIGLIGGPELYANDYFPIIATIVYLISFSIVGFILVTSGIRRPYGRR
ncbi:MAG: hypothetical protein JWN49_329 [Parcubacteria group bacterium]|nr:hypothetical protein [Parcubacteria group bacterium]